MTRDYKNRSAGRRRSDRRPWAWLIFGVLVGAAGSTFAFLGHPRLHHWWQSREDGPRVNVEKHSQSSHARTREDGAGAKPQFDFYTILPEMEVVVPEREITSRARARASSGPLVLQAGSFRRLEQADEQKARLALLGIESEIQAVRARNQETWHRVRIGPFEDLAALDRVRQRLERNHIGAMVLELKD